MKRYCLGYAHPKCDTCQHEENWQVLNQMPDALRRQMQIKMERVSDDKCRLTGMGDHVPKHKTS